MKKSLIILLIISLCLTLISCSSGSNYTEDSDDYVSMSPPVDDMNDYEDDNDNSNEQPEPQVDDSIEYISDRQLDYVKAENVFRLFFGFQNFSKQYVDASGKATITIFDNNNNQLYKNTLSFDKNNFGSWSNAYWNTSKYLCSIDIDRSNFKHSNSSSGVFAISVELDDGSSFSESKHDFYGLPEHDWASATCTKPKTCTTCGATTGSAEGHDYNYDGICDCGAKDPKIEAGLAKCSLQLPSLPKSVSNYNYDDTIEATITITNVSYEFECDSENRIELKVYFSGKKTYDERGTGQSDSYPVGWKLYDASGNVFDTGTFYTPSVAMGESFVNKEATLIYAMDEVSPGAFRLEILNSN